MTWTVDQLEAFRHIKDQPADDAIAAIFASQSSGVLRTALSKIASNDSKELAHSFPESMVPGPLYDLINSELSQSFTDTDIEMFRRTHKVWREKGIKFVYILLFRSLPYTYEAEMPANVLTMTRLLETHPARRIIETAQFVFDVMDKDWWMPGNRGIITTVKIRLMHAAMRHMILNNEAQTPWDFAWGQPICQEDMVATNQIFSLTFFEGMAMLGDELEAEDKEAWFYTWQRVGKILGVQDALQVSNVAEAISLQSAVYKHLFVSPTHKAGIELTKALVGALEQFLMPEKFILIQMKKMLYDEAYPNIINDMLAPTYQEKYPELFQENAGPNGLLPEHIYDHFLEELAGFHGAVSKVRSEKKAANDAANVPNSASITDKHLDILSIVLSDIKKLPLAGVLEHDFELIRQKTSDIFHKLLGFGHHIDEAEGQISGMVKLKDKLMIVAIDSISVILVDLLSVHFRPGKDAGFRISDDLKEHWELG
jgi:ER-bound oxygenase mpaB/B'/Rubber oxygenase, catalytic domain